MTKTLSLLFSLILFCSHAGAAEGVAKVIMLRGKVNSEVLGTVKSLKKGDWVKEGSIVKTSPRSFVKFLFIDKSSMNLGPKSEMEIKSFPKNKAGIINLIKGKIRAKVTKNYMQMDKQKSKLFIKTRTAAMGVRGTEFQVLYNQENRVTSLVTFEGEVAMAKLGDNIRAAVTQNFLEAKVSGDLAVKVKRGQYSGTSVNSNRATLPVKISPNQLESMKQDDGGGKKNKVQAKAMRSTIPPGVDAKAFGANSQVIEKQMVSLIGNDSAEKLMDSTRTEISNSRESEVPAEGFFDAKTGAYAPPSGGLIDTSTALYVPPPEGSQFDPNANVYIPPPTVGSYDMDTGDYIPPAGYKLTAEGSFEADAQRGPASVGGTADSTMAPPTEMLIGPPPTDATAEEGYAGNYMDTVIFDEFNNPPPPPLPTNFTKVNFTINVN